MLRRTYTSAVLAVSIWAVAGAIPAHAASFPCDVKTLAPDEKAICANRDLNDLDVRMVTEFKWLSGMFAMGMRGDLQDQQTAWLKTRQACGKDKACIRKAYGVRLKQFDDFYNRFERPTPMQ